MAIDIDNSGWMSDETKRELGRLIVHLMLHELGQVMDLLMSLDITDLERLEVAAKKLIVLCATVRDK